MAGRTAIVSVRIVSAANSRGFRKAAADAERMSARVAKATGKIAAIATAASVAGAAVGQVGIAAGVMGAGLAGAAALAVPSLVAIKLGTDGIKQAAQQAVPALSRLKQSVSGRFASDMIPGFTALGRVADSLNPSMTALAGTISGVFNNLAGTVERNTGGLQALTRGASTFVSALGPGLNQLVSGMISFGANASKAAGIIGGELGNAIGKVGQWIGNLPIEKLITTYTPMIKQLIGGLGDLAGPIVKLFGDLALAAGPSLAAIFTSLGTAVTALTPPLTQIARDAGPALAETLATLAPALGTLGGSFATLISAVAPVLPPLAQFAATLVDTLGPALPAALIGVTAFSAAMKFAPAVTATASAVMGLAKGFVALRTIVTILGPLGAIQAYLPLIGTAITGMGGALTAVATGMRVAAVATWSWTAALLANPITWVVLAVVALIAVIVLIATKTTWFQTIWAAMVSFVTTAWNTMTAFVSATFSAAMALVQSIVSAAVAFISAQWNLISTVASAVWSAITAVVSGAANVISSVISGAINIAIGVFNTFRSIGTSVFGAVASAVGAIGSAVQTVIGWVQSLINAISNIRFPSPPSWLSSIFELGDSATIIAHRYAGGTITAAPGAFTGSVPNLRGTAPMMVNYYVDQSSHVQVDGSGIVDANAVAYAVAGADTRTARTQGRVPSVVLGGAGRG